MNIEHKAWSEWFEAEDVDGDEWCLCGWIEDRDLDDDLKEVMLARLMLFKPEGKDDSFFWWDNVTTCEDDPARATAVGLLVAMSEGDW